MALRLQALFQTNVNYMYYVVKVNSIQTKYKNSRLNALLQGHIFIHFNGNYEIGVANGKWW